VSIRIAHLSDIHFGGEIPDAVEAALEAVAAFRPTVTVVTGDITLNGLPREFRAARAWIDRLPRPVLVTPGNHDTPYWNLPLRALVPFERYRRYIGPARTSRFDAAGLAIRCLNSARGAQPRPNWSKGAISVRRLAALDWGPQPEARLKVFACHHPLIDLEGAPVTGGVRRGPRAAAMLVDAGVELVLTGHVHNPFVLPLGRGARACYAVGAGTLSLRLRGAPAGFTTLVADDERIAVESLGWVHGRFQSAEFWTLARGEGRPIDEAQPQSSGEGGAMRAPS
jgi:3',5'-cyclic AMP phosphodiesterase CpdA